MLFSIVWALCIHAPCGLTFGRLQLLSTGWPQFSSTHVTEMMEEVHVESDLDVSVLFTTVPTGEAVSISCKRLREDGTRET